MEKKERAKEKELFFLRILLFSFLVLLINAGFFIYKYGDLQSDGLTGFSVSTIEKTVFSVGNMPRVSQIFLILQWGVIILLLGYAAIKDLITLAQKREVSVLNTYKKPAKNKTDMDVLYDALKKKRELRVSTIAKSFNVSRDIAMEWCKILESGELATIDYPGFGEPVIKIKEEKIENNERQLGKKERSENKQGEEIKQEEEGEEKLEEIKQEKKYDEQKKDKGKFLQRLKQILMLKRIVRRSGKKQKSGGKKESRKKNLKKKK